MAFKSSRDGAKKPAKKDRVERKKPLHERFSKFDYEASISSIKILIKFKGRTDLRKIAETESREKKSKDPAEEKD